MTEIPEQFKETGFKVSYKELKKCVMKKELGETTNECQKIWKDLGVEEI